MIDQNLTQRAFTSVLNHFVATGRAPHYAELAEALEIEAEQAREVQRAAVEAAPLASCWLAHDTDYIESWAPFSNVPTHYLNQRRRHSEVVRPMRHGVAGRALAIPRARGSCRIEMPGLR
jgi:hypothetical protein